MTKRNDINSSRSYPRRCEYVVDDDVINAH